MKLHLYTEKIHAVHNQVLMQFSKHSVANLFEFMSAKFKSLNFIQTSGHMVGILCKLWQKYHN